MTASLAAPPASRRLPNSRQLIALIGVVSLALIAGAWFFELVLHLRPCKLCLEQRAPHYAAIGLALVGLVLARSARLQWFVLLGLAGLMAWSTGLGVYHAGVEWKFWEGPTSCTIGATGGDTPVNVLDALNSTKAPSCTEATLRVLGLSFAGWNVLTSMALAAMALWATFRKRG